MKDNRKYLYVLECEDECYYIGQTDDLVRRFRQHKEQGNEGSVWTSNHKPIRIIHECNIEDYAQEDAINFENQLTIEYINKFGWKNVRGGKYIFTYEEHHYKLLLKYNDLIDGEFVPKATLENIEIFQSMKEKLSTFEIIPSSAYIFVLKLELNKFFVGRSSNLQKDIRKHIYSSHREWTTKYAPLELVDIIEDHDLGTNHPCKFRNSIVFNYMKHYGWKNVRGGDYVFIDNEKIFKLLKKKNPELLNDY